MDYDRLVRKNKMEELSGAIRTKTQLILNFPYGIKIETIKMHKLFEKELSSTDQEEIKRRGDMERNKRHNQKKKRKKLKKDEKRKKEEPVVDNKGLSYKIPSKFQEKINFAMNQSEILKPCGPCYIETNDTKQNEAAADNWNVCNSTTSSFFGYKTLHFVANK